MQKMRKIEMLSQKTGKIISVSANESFLNNVLGWSNGGWSKTGGWIER